VFEGERVVTSFRANVKGTTSFPFVPLLGTITADAITTEVADYQEFPSITVELFSDNIVIQTIDDDITLEYDDRLDLTFALSPDVANLAQMLEAEGEYLRNTVSVTIVDNDGRTLVQILNQEVLHVICVPPVLQSCRSILQNWITLLMRMIVCLI
jgi:hypothetical protein